MRTKTFARRSAVLAVLLAGLLALGRCGNGNMVTNPMPTMTPMPASTPTPAPTPAGSSATYLYGHVVDSLTGAVLDGAKVVILQKVGGQSPRTFLTGADGAYKIDGLIPDIETSLFATKAGYVARGNTFRPRGAVLYDIAVTKYRSTPGKTEYAD
jgi:hypothetical protein